MDWYVRQVLTEDRIVQRALEARGLRVSRIDWADAHFNWSSATYALFRTTWDYFHRFEEFCTWLHEVATLTKLLNPLEMVRWNMDKHYLLDLKEKGINVTESLYVEAGTNTDLGSLHHQTSWTETVLKPTISGAGRHTYRLSADDLVGAESTFQQLIAQEAMMLQPFQHNVVARGEIALMVIGGQFTHAVLKKAKPGDFRVQDDFGGSVHDHVPSTEEIRFAEAVVAICEPIPVYARVDVIRDNDGKLALTELELIEPELWFRNYPPAAECLAECITKLL